MDQNFNETKNCVGRKTIHNVLVSLVQMPHSTKVGMSHLGKKNKVDLGKVHINLEANTSIDLDKKNLLEGGVSSPSRGGYSTP